MDQQEWTIMVYMAGDNNLSVDMAYAMQQIKEVAGEDTANVNLFVYYDGVSSTIPTLYCDFSDSEKPRHVRSFKVRDKFYNVELKRNENAADYRSIGNFVDWCVNKVQYLKDGEIQYGRKAERYALIFSGHSLGFQDIGLFKDEGSDKAMSMDQLNGLLERLTKSKEQLEYEGGDLHPDVDETGRFEEIIGQKLDILGFDSCVMGMLEVGYQFEDFAKTMIASEGSVPSAGWTYAKILGNLAHNSKNQTVEQITARFVSDFITGQATFTIGGVSVDMAAWDLSKLDGLNSAFEGLVDALTDCFAEMDSTIARQMERVLLQVHWKCQSYMFEQNVDLGDFCELLLEECAALRTDFGDAISEYVERIEKGSADVLQKLQETVILSGFSGGNYQYSNGISLFWPWSWSAYSVSRANYMSLQFVSKTGAGKKWNRFLEKYLHEVTYRRALGPTEKGTEPVGILLESALEPEVRAYSMPDTKQRYHSYRYEDDLDVYLAKESTSCDQTAAQFDHKLSGNGESKISGSGESKMSGNGQSKISGSGESKMSGSGETKMSGSGQSKMSGSGESKMSGSGETKMSGSGESKMSGSGQSKMPGSGESKMSGSGETKISGSGESKMSGSGETKMSGSGATKMSGSGATKMSGSGATKMSGSGATKMSGSGATKMSGSGATKMSGSGASKLAGGEGTAGRYFDSLKAFKNLESKWNISGFTKEPTIPSKDAKAKETNG